MNWSLKKGVAWSVAALFGGISLAPLGFINWWFD
jgi:hypothetical protein